VEELTGRIAVVTGAASGIGRVLADRFAAEGMSLVLADIEQAPLDAAVSELGEQTEVLARVTDVTDPAAVEALRDAALERFGTYFVVCNNAGVGGLGDTTWEGPLAGWQWVLGVNLWGVIHGIRAFVPHLVERGEGHVVNTGSLASLGAAPWMGPYVASKHAVLGISEALQLELEMTGSAVRVHVLAPGFLKTGIADSARNFPADLAAEAGLDASGDGEASPLMGIVRDLVGNGLPPELLADALLDAMGTGRFFVTTHPETADRLGSARAATIDGTAPQFSDYG